MGGRRGGAEDGRGKVIIAATLGFVVLFCFFTRALLKAKRFFGVYLFIFVELLK